MTFRRFAATRIRRFATLAALAAVCATVLACSAVASVTTSPVEPAPTLLREDRPTIGLVLGGGGARGPAHIGVLRVLDEMCIPVDYVGGTSMGAIIASLFALGMTPDQIEAQLNAIDWDDLFFDTPDRHRRTYRRKEDDNAFFLPVEFGFRKGRLVTNRGIIAGQKLGFAFPNPQIYTAGYRGFDHLAYPLRTVGTDLRTGRMVVMDRGNLVQAVRASMSIPGLFPPVRWGGLELIDGGVVRNLPVDVVRAMGADIIIAVDVGMLPEETSEEKLGSIAGILAQTLTIQARANVSAQLDGADLVIQVALGDISFKDFKRVSETIPLGETAARALADSLARYSIPRDAYLAHLQAHRLPSRGHPVIDRIVAENGTVAHDRAIRRRIGQQEGQVLDLARLKDDLADIYDMGVAELVDFAVTVRDSQTLLTVAAHPKLYAPHILRVGARFTGQAKDRSEVSARLRHTWLEMNRRGGELRSDLQLGRVMGIRSELYQPLTWSRVPFLAGGGWWRDGNYDWYQDLVDVAELNVREFAGFAQLGSRLSHWGELRGGVRYGYVDASVPSVAPRFEGRTAGFTGRLAWDSMDQPLFPTRGVDGEIDVFAARTGLGSDLVYDRVRGRASGATAWGRSTFRFTLEGGSGLASDLPAFETFTAGGLDRLSGYQDDKLRGHTFGIGSVRWYRPIHGSPSLFPTIWYLGLGLEVGNAWAARDHARLDDLRYGFNLSLTASTYLGPVVVAYGRMEDGHDAAYLALGSRTGLFE